MKDEADHESNPRRGFLKRVAAATGSIPLAHGLVGGAAVGVIAGPVRAAPGAKSLVSDVVGYTSLSPAEAAFTEAMVNVMCPADSFTPNGVECGLAIYIDRQLAGSFGKGAKRYLRGPWTQGKPQHGYQLPLTPEQYFKAGLARVNQAIVLRNGRSFDQLTPAQANAFLTDLSSGKIVDAELDLGLWFNELVYPLFEQACFADPIYGGNHDKVFWKVIGYPGLPATNTVNMVQFRGKPFPGARNPKSIGDFS
jgi:gluconate 2-dehydrogenase gamma chain